MRENSKFVTLMLLSKKGKWVFITRITNAMLHIYMLKDFQELYQII